VESLTDEYVKSRGSDWGKDVNALDDQLRVTRKEIMETAARYIGSGYVLLYKHKGTDQHIVKVEKPPISPVETNAGSQSAFVRRIEAMPVTPFTPQFLDYEKGFVRTELGGAPLIYLQNRENDLFHLYFRFDMGKWNNPYLPLAAQYLQFLSTPQHSATEITRAFYSLACSYSVNVENETTTIVLSGLSENMQKALALFEELLGKCTADTTALAALKERISKARANAKLNKNTIMQGMINYARYGEHNPFNDVLRPEQMNALQADTLVHLLHTLENFRHTLIYYGPLSADTLKTTAGRLHILPADWQPYPAKMKFSFQSADKPAVLFTSYDMVQSEIYWVRNTDPYDPSKETVIDVFNNYFGGGMASVVFQTIRESKALAYATFAEYVSPLKKENPYFVIAYIGCQADKMHEAVAGMNQLLDTLPMAEQNFSLARQSIRKDLETERFTEDQIIFSWLAAKDLGWNQDRRRIEYEQLGSIRSADVKKFHDSEISHKPYTYCIVGSDQKLNMDDLKKMGELKILKLEEIFGY
jgi:predicted Zn-dependent peptidase